MAAPRARDVRFTFGFGAACADAFQTGLPVLAGDASESLLEGSGPPEKSGRLTLVRLPECLLGGAVVPVRRDLEKPTLETYLEMLDATCGMHLARVWNFVPEINETGPDGLENYRSFCRGRFAAFEARHGPGFQRLLPAASAVGRPPGALVVIFAAFARAPRHLENPLQVPAYRYPAKHGPRPPSFARASVVECAGALRVFISGTASIRGHQTMAPGDTAGQLRYTLGNLEEISKLAGLGADLGAGRCASRAFKVYIRHGTDHPAIAHALESRLLRPGDRVAYLKAEICRRQLNVEIEATIRS